MHYHECLTCYLDPRVRLEVAKIFIEIQISEVDRQRLFNCKTIVRSWSMHSIYSINHLNNVMLQAHDYTCSCMHCVNDVVRVCPNHAHVNSWQLITLEPCSNTNLLVEVEDDDSNWEATNVDNNQLAFELQVGDNFLVRANFVNEENHCFRCSSV